jgi:ABC-type glycerol-3-phosphate transport system substrate-binding protein
VAHRRRRVHRDAARRLRQPADLDGRPEEHAVPRPGEEHAPGGYAGKLGYASAGAAADFIIVNMVAEAISGSKTPKEAMERAQKRAERYYRV